MKSITIEEIRSAEVNTYSVKDDSPKQPEAEQEAGDFTAPETIENAETRHKETQRELALMEGAAKARREAYKNALHGGTKGEKDKAHAELESAETALSEYRLYAAIIEENARAAWLSENLPKICAVLNKYTGRKIGDKTRDKIRDELTAAIGRRASLYLASETYSQDHIFVNAPYWSQWLEIYKHFQNRNFRDAEGKLIKLAPEDFAISTEFCANPNAKTREILAAHAALMAAREALQEAINNFNGAVGGVFKRANVHEWYQQQDITPAKR